MQKSVEQRSLGMVTRETDENLAFFRELAGPEHEKKHHLLLQNGGEEPEAPLGLNPFTVSILDSALSEMMQNNRVDDILNSGNDKPDCERPLAVSCSPLRPSSENEINHSGISSACPVSLELSDSKVKPPTSNTKAPENSAVSVKTKATNAASNQYTSSGGRQPAAAKINRSATPTGRPILSTTMSKTGKPTRSSTPTSRATESSAKPAPAPPAIRSSTPTRSTARSATPTTTKRPFTASKSAPRSATPTRRPSNPPGDPCITSAPPRRSSSVSKSAPAATKKPITSRGTSPIVRSRPLKATDVPGSANNDQTNQKMGLLNKPASASASRVRPLAVSVQPSTADTASSNGRARRQSCSPSRGQKPEGNGFSRGVTAVNRTRPGSSPDDSPNPVLIGTKMVERVINMRRLAPPKQDSPNASGGKSSSKRSSGFGRSLSKKSLDMALRHMDIKRSVQGNLRPLETNVTASLTHSVKSNGSSKSKSTVVSDSPLATSSNASSELGMNNNPNCSYGGDLEDVECNKDSEHLPQAS